MKKIIQIKKANWTGGGNSTYELLGYFSVPENWTLTLEDAVASFLERHLDKILFHNVLNVYRPVGPAFPANVNGLDIKIVEIDSELFSVADLSQYDIQQKLIKTYPLKEPLEKIDYSEFKSAIFGTLGTSKLSTVEEYILKCPNMNWNYIFKQLRSTNILLTAVIRGSNQRPEWFDDYLKLMDFVNHSCTFKDFKKEIDKNDYYWLPKSR